jgi:hypothetical protein
VYGNPVILKVLPPLNNENKSIIKEEWIP